VVLCTFGCNVHAVQLLTAPTSPITPQAEAFSVLADFKIHVTQQQ